MDANSNLILEISNAISRTNMPKHLKNKITERASKIRSLLIDNGDPNSIIRDIVFDYYNINGDCDYNRKYGNEVLARQIIFHFLKKYTTCTLKEIAAMYSKKQHGTVTAGIKTVNNLIDTERSFRHDIKEIQELITSSLTKKEN